MAKAIMKLPEDFLLRVSKLADKTDEIVPRVLQAGGEVVEAKVKSNLQAVVGSGTKEESRSTGELVGALGVSPAMLDRDGNFNVKVGFDEPRRQQNTAVRKRSYKERTNAMIANVLEYGKHGQPAKPFLKPAKSASKNACIEAMKAKLESEVNGV
ncbi:MAG: HK97 gp10 family phage protein [Eubacteriales bacterium]|nr:HK97 gp10 family phage protein [Eubacteriales bacterium]